MLKYGNNSIGHVYFGSNSIGKAYYGSELVFQKGSSPGPGPGPGPEPEPGLIYQLPAQVSTPNYDTGVKLFDTVKSFTVYFEAAFNNYQWTSVQGVIGIDTTTMFRLGRVTSGKDHSEGEVVDTANRYTALIMNPTASGKDCTSVRARSNSSPRYKYAVTYDSETRRVFVAYNGSYSVRRYYTVSAEVVSGETLKIWVGNGLGTCYELKVYDYCMTDVEANALVGAVPPSE